MVEEAKHESAKRIRVIKIAGQEEAVDSQNRRRRLMIAGDFVANAGNDISATQ